MKSNRLVFIILQESKRRIILSNCCTVQDTSRFYVDPIEVIFSMALYVAIGRYFTFLLSQKQNFLSFSYSLTEDLGFALF
jgi:hypothetical protein